MNRNHKHRLAALAAAAVLSVVAIPVRPVHAQSAAPDAAASSGGGASSSTLAKTFAPTSISGFVDTYYDYNSNLPASDSNGFRSFDTNTNVPALNLVELNFDKTPDAAKSRVGYHISVGSGRAMETMSATDPTTPDVDRWLKEGYLTYLAPAGKGVQIDAGKFVTPAGAEVVETKDNWNYSRGLLFSYAIPYFHFGLRAKYAFNDKISLTGFVVNGWNNLIHTDGGKPLTPGVSVAWTPTKKLSIAQNFMVGEEQPTNNSWRQLWDTVVTYLPTGRLSLMANYDYGYGDRITPTSDPVSWTGIAGYVKYAFRNRYALATRYEYYDDRDGFTTGTAQNIQEVTGTLERMFTSHVLTRIEFRRDVSNHPTFIQGIDSPVANQNTATAGFVFMFNHAMSAR